MACSSRKTSRAVSSFMSGVLAERQRWAGAPSHRAASVVVGARGHSPHAHAAPTSCRAAVVAAP
eukprot:scaffold31_cov312-Prasinococcus_capsulatus_cf.AAC.9